MAPIWRQAHLKSQAGCNIQASAFPGGLLHADPGRWSSIHEDDEHLLDLCWWNNPSLIAATVWIGRWQFMASTDGTICKSWQTASGFQSNSSSRESQALRTTGMQTRIHTARSQAEERTSREKVRNRKNAKITMISSKWQCSFRSKQFSL